MNFWLKIFLFIFLGFILKRQKLIPQKIIKYFIDAAVYFIVPLFILAATWTNTSAPADMGKICLVAAGVVAAGALYALLFVGSIKPGGRNIPYRNVCMTFMFMNSAYMAIPVNTFYFGNDGMSFTIIYNIVVTVLMSTIGIWLIGRKGFSDIFQMPFVYASIVGLGLNFAKVSQPPAVIEFTGIMKDYAMPAMLTLAGYQINLASVPAVRLAISGAAFRMLGGFAAGLILALILGMKGNALGVAVMVSCMPPAVNNYILAEKYKTDPEFAATAIFIGTMAAFFIIPAVWEILKAI